MQTDSSIPYPRPNYSDSDLLTKELVNGTFTKALFSELKSFKVPMDRYNVTEDDLTNISLTKGNITPQSYDISMRDLSLDGVKELGWQPATRKSNVPEPQVVYDPLKHYAFVEWVGINSTDLQDTIPSSNTALYDVSVTYYDDDNAGLFGFLTIKDTDGNVTDVFASFYSLKTITMTTLGRLPNGLNLAGSTYVGYVKGAYIINFYGGTYVSFTLLGGVFTANNYSDYHTALGDDGLILIENNIATKTYVLDNELNVIQEIEGRYCIRGGGFASSPNKYLFGTKIGNTYYFLRDNDSSYKFKKTASGWRADVVDNPTWKYTKRLKYDYATDNWLQHPLKTLKYNMITQGLFVKNHLPKHDDGDEVEFPNSDMHGDFARVVKPDGSRAYYHTFNFRKWKPLTGEATTYLYGCMGRMWTNGRVDGVSGLMPYTIAVKSVNDLLGSKKTVLQFSGFIFRGGQ